MKIRIAIAAALTALAFALRWPGMSNPVWIDEAVFWYRVNHGTLQEFVPVVVVRFFDLHGAAIRWPFLLSGVATVPAVYFLFRDKWIAFCMALIVAIHPLFVFWSPLARPYSITGLLCVLSWYSSKWTVPAILANPHAIFAMRWRGNAWKIIGLVALVYVMLVIRVDDASVCLKWSFLINAKRLWYLPGLGGLLYFGRLLDGPDQRARLRSIFRLAKRQG